MQNLEPCAWEKCAHEHTEKKQKKVNKKWQEKRSDYLVIYHCGAQQMPDCVCISICIDISLCVCVIFRCNCIACLIATFERKNTIFKCIPSCLDLNVILSHCASFTFSVHSCLYVAKFYVRFVSIFIFLQNENKEKSHKKVWPRVHSLGLWSGSTRSKRLSAIFRCRTVILFEK